MGQKGHIMDQKGLKMHEKKAKNRVFGHKKTCFLAEFSLVEWGGYPPPLNGQSLCSKKLSGKGVPPPPLTGKIRQVVFEGLPCRVS